MRRRPGLLWLLAGAMSCGTPANQPPLTGPERARQAAARYEQARQRAVRRTEQARQQARREDAEAERLDSLWLDSVLREALAVARPHLGEAHFDQQFEARDTTQGHATVRLQIGNLLAGRQQHLLVRRKSVSRNRQWVNTVRFDVYRVARPALTPVLSQEQWDMEYVGDTLRDVNGDGYKDFIVDTYGTNGCCLKAFSEVYLFRPATGGFSQGFEFINPTFSARERVIRGVCYGHPGATQMYKYRWRGAAVDTLEYIFYEEKPDGRRTRNILRARYQMGKGPADTLRLARMPPEYTRIFGYDWFTDKLR